MRAFAMAAVLGACVATTGCAALFCRSSDTLTFRSRPEHARVEIDGMLVGRTPLTLPVQRSLTVPQVRISLDGYEPQHVMLQSRFNPVAILDVLFAPALAIDAVTGVLMKYSVFDYDVELIPESRQSAQP